MELSYFMLFTRSELPSFLFFTTELRCAAWFSVLFSIAGCNDYFFKLYGTRIEGNEGIIGNNLSLTDWIVPLW